MPRKTHPRPRVKHSRAHIREQFDRKAEARYRRAKALYADDNIIRLDKGHLRVNGSLVITDEELDDDLEEFIHPDQARDDRTSYWSWWATRSRSEWARNWQTYCSCAYCRRIIWTDRPSRTSINNAWRADWQADIEEIDSGKNL
jgi:hypothetical protein